MPKCPLEPVNATINSKREKIHLKRDSRANVRYGHHYFPQETKLIEWFKEFIPIARCVMTVIIITSDTIAKRIAI